MLPRRKTGEKTWVLTGDDKWVQFVIVDEIWFHFVTGGRDLGSEWERDKGSDRG